MAIQPFTVHNKPFIKAAEFPHWQQQMTEQRRSMDAFSNVLARLGFGTTNLLEGTAYPLTRLSRNYILLQSLYRNNWIVRKVVDSIADDMMKNWISLSSEITPKQIDQFDAVVSDTLTEAKLTEAMHWGRLYGGAACVIIIKGHENKLHKPLDPEDVDIDSYRGIIVLDRWSGITPSADINGDINDPINFGLPNSYNIVTERAAGYTVHASRVLRFIGRPLPNWERQAEIYWGMSEVENFYEELKKRDNTSWNLASLVFRANILSLRQENLSNMLSGVGASRTAQANFQAVIRAVNDMMSNQGLVVLPEKGGMEQHSYSFGGLGEVYEQFKQDICGATGYPYSRLFGKPSGGMGTTNEGDEHTYYDMISMKQRSELDPQLKKLLPVIAMSTWGKIPKDFDWKFNPVRSMSSEEEAELGSKYTTAVIESYNAGVITQQVAVKELKQQSEVTNLFSNITDEDVEAADDEYPPGPEEMMGGGGGLFGNEGATLGEGAEPGMGPEQEAGPPGPSKGGKGQIPAVKTSKPRKGKAGDAETDDSVFEDLLVKFKKGYQFGKQIGRVTGRNDDGTYMVDVKGRSVVASQDAFEVYRPKAKDAEPTYKTGPGAHKAVELLKEEAKVNGRKRTPVKPFSESSPTVKAAVRSDPRQQSLYGEEHTKELQKYYGNDAALDENPHIERIVHYAGLDIAVENEVGSLRKGKDWEQIMTRPYGYVLNPENEGVDGDHVDVFLGPEENASHVYVAHVLNSKTDKYDEDKCMLGFTSAAAAKEALIENYNNDERFFDSMEKIPILEFIDKLKQPGEKITK